MENNKKDKTKNKGGIGRILRVMIPKCFKAAPKHWIFMICTDCTFSVISVMLVAALQYFLDNVSGAIKGTKSIKIVIISLLILGFGKLIHQLLNAIINSTPDIFFQKVNSVLTGELHGKISRLKPIAFEETAKLDHINKASQGLANAIGFVSSFGYIFTFYGFYIVAMFFYLLSLNRLLALAILLIFIPAGVSQIIRIKVYNKAEDKSAPIRREYDYYEECMVSRDYFKETRLLGAFGYFRRLYLEALDALQVIKFKAAFKTGMTDLGLSVITIAGYGSVMLLLFKCLLTGDISVGAFAAVFASVDDLYGIIDNMIRYAIGDMATQYGSINNYLNFLEMEEDTGEAYEPDDEIEIDIDNVSFAYPSDAGEVNAVAERQFRYDHYGNLIDSDLLKDVEEEKTDKEKKYALRNCSLHIKKGETIAIVGENGSGKSTIIRLIIGLYEPDCGTVSYNGEDISKYKKSDIYKNTSAVFQKYQRYQMTLKENICISSVDREADSKEQKPELTGELDAIAEQAGITMDEKTYPEGCETMLSREFEGVDLSGGQWQRIAIGRGFYRNHGLIVLDEPTSAIDPYEETRIYNQFAEISRDKTAVIVTHRLGSVRLADRIVVMKGGEIVQVGTHEELMGEADGEYARLYRSQEQWYMA
ncbi:MAG: ABC transporter ATP-binding protein/permease [Lachnospiraceae bacterium]